MTIGKSAFDLPGIWTYLKKLKLKLDGFSIDGRPGTTGKNLADLADQLGGSTF